MANTIVKIVPTIFPKENSIRTIIKYLKLKETSSKYPRRYSEIIKKDI